MTRSKKMRGLKGFIGLLALGTLGVVGTAASEPLTYEGAIFSFDTSGSGTNWTLTFTADFSDPGFTSSSEFWNDYIEAWSFSAPGNISSVTLTSYPGSDNWLAQGTSQANANGCSTSANDDAVCVDWGKVGSLDGYGPDATFGDVYTWVVNVVFDNSQATWDIGNFHFLTVTCVEDECSKSGGLISVPVSVPEPGTVGLLGLGLAGLGFGFRRRRKI
jgi:hypothetical protein